MLIILLATDFQPIILVETRLHIVQQVLAYNLLQLRVILTTLQASLQAL